MSTNLPQPIDFDELDEIVAREYLRVSHDKSGRVRSNEEQHDENVPAIERKGWRLGKPYEDVGSASKYQRKRRADFDRLLADLEGDTFGAHVLILWEGSRGSRKVSEWSRMLEACERTGVRIFVTSDRALYDVSSPRDWKSLMDDAVASEHEVRKTSKRTRRSSNANAANGTFSGGRRPFGYETNGVDVRHEEATIIRECVRFVLGGMSVRWIAGELNRRGIKTSAGNAWHPGPLGKLLVSERIVGKRVHHGEVVGKADWPAIIDEVTHKRVVVTLAARTPVGRRGRTPWLLTGLLRCERCGAALVSNTDIGGIRRYVCRKAPGYKGCGGLGIKAHDLEELLGDLVTERLADVEARRSAVAGPDDGDEIAELDRIAAMRVELADDKVAGRVSRETALEDAAALDRHQRAIETELAAKVHAVAPLDFVIAEGFVGRRWEDLKAHEQRVVLDALVDHVTVAPASTRGSTKFEPERVRDGDRIVWKV